MSVFALKSGDFEAPFQWLRGVLRLSKRSKSKGGVVEGTLGSLKKSNVQGGGHGGYVGSLKKSKVQGWGVPFSRGGVLQSDLGNMGKQARTYTARSADGTRHCASAALTRPEPHCRESKPGSQLQIRSSATRSLDFARVPHIYPADILRRGQG